MSIELEFNLFQDAISRDVAFCPSVTVSAEGKRSVRYGPIQRFTSNEFLARGLLVLKGILESFRSIADPLELWRDNYQPLWTTYMGKPRTVIMHAVPGGSDATIYVVHYDALPGSPIYGEKTETPLAVSPEEFALIVLQAFTKTRDFRRLEHYLIGARTFLCVYQDDRSGRYYWFDWMKLKIPEIDAADGSDLLITAWGFPQVFDLESLQGQVRRLITKSLLAFPRRCETENPNPFPRGSQVIDAGMAEQKRVVIFQDGESSDVVLEAYNVEYAGDGEREQVPSGIRRVLAWEASEEMFYAALTDLFNACTRE